MGDEVQSDATDTDRAAAAIRFDIIVVPHLEVLKQHGTARCSLAVIAAEHSQGAQCGSDQSNDGGTANWLWDIYPTPGLAGIIVEVHWTPQTALAEKLHAWLPRTCGSSPHSHRLANRASRFCVVGALRTPAARDSNITSLSSALCSSPSAWPIS